MATGIANAAEINPLAATLHDARFTADAMTFDAAAQTFALNCWVFEARAGAQRRWQAYRVSFSNVTDCKVNVKEQVRYYELATIRFSERDGILDLVAHYGIEIKLTIRKLDGALTETGGTRDTWE